MNKLFFISLAIFSLSSPALAQDLNSALASHVCSGQWAAAIADIDLMLSQAPAYRSELLAYRSRLLALNSASAPGVGCSGQSQPVLSGPVEEYKVRYSGNSSPGLPSVSDLEQRAREMLPNR